MSSETFRSVFRQVRSLVEIDHGLEEVEWELIGGEITSLPVSYWQENLPFALDQCRDLNSQLKTPGSINVLSNLIFSDQKVRRDYLDLFEKYGDRAEMCLYTSWEPDTNRFGRGAKLFDRWKETVAEAHVEKKILDVILTRAVVELGPEYLLEQFLPLGIKDFSIKMISPFGSGRSFWQPNMVEFAKMSDYLVRLLELIPAGITFTPADEMTSAVFRGTSYQCIGNFRYDLAIEPNGLTTFNANQTTDEASVAETEIYLGDEDWAWKVLSGNTAELDNKLSVYHDYCFQCEFHSYCAGGWYHYRTAATEDVRAWDQGDCPGYKKLWKAVENKYGAYNRPLEVHRESLERIRSIRLCSKETVEEPIQSAPFHEWVKSLNGRTVLLRGDAFSKPLIQRMWAYQAVGASMVLGDSEFEAIDAHEQRVVVEHLVYDDLFSLELSPHAVWAWCDRQPTDPLSKLLTDGMSRLQLGSLSGELIAADHNAEILRWLLRNPRSGQPAGVTQDPVIRVTSQRLATEQRMHLARTRSHA